MSGSHDRSTDNLSQLLFYPLKFATSSVFIINISSLKGCSKAVVGLEPLLRGRGGVYRGVSGWYPNLKAVNIHCADDTLVKMRKENEAGGYDRNTALLALSRNGIYLKF